jgi:hypothetical protein|tara:strand:+ start:5000 stop:6160 length:1161 start_codon:yes stop_codon:yes gene_type:complete
MILFGSAWGVLSAFLVFVTGFIVSFVLARRFLVNKQVSLFLYLWHTIFCVLYCLYVLNDNGDAIMYYQASLSSNINVSLGTSFVVYLVSFLTKGIGLSFLGAFLVFNIIGFIGLLSFWGVLRQVVQESSRVIQRMAFFVVLLPSVSFWTSAIGKDALSFLSVGLALWAASDMRRRIFLMFFSIIIMLCVRPHMAALMVFSLLVFYVVKRDVPAFSRFTLAALSLIASVFVVPLALNYAGLSGDASLNQIDEYIEQRQSFNQGGGGGIDIAAMSFPVKIFTYIFRPLPFEAGSLFQFLASVENAFFLFIFLCVSVRCLKLKKIKFFHDNSFILSYAFTSWVILALTTANFGIAARQKWMFLPMLLVMAFSIIGTRREAVSVPEDRAI